MTSETQIAQFAVSRCGVSQNISRLDERSTAADQCRLWYEHCRDATLRDFPWGFATKIEPLALLPSDSYFGYSYVYAYPEDCLYAKAITNVSVYNGMQHGVGGLRWFWDESSDLLGAYTTPYRIIQSTDGNNRAIATAWSDAYLVYTAKSPIVALYPPDFVDAVAWRLAMEIAKPLQAKVTVAELMTMYRSSLANAWANNSNEGGPVEIPESPSISCR
jgi:hypothetical protein